MPSIPDAIYIISVITISGRFMARSIEIIIFNIVAIAYVTKCGNRNAIIIPIPSPSLGSELDGVNKTNSAPIYSKVIPSDILVKTRGKVLFFIIKLLSFIFLIILPVFFYFLNIKQESIKKVVCGINNI